MCIDFDASRYMNDSLGTFVTKLIPSPLGTMELYPDMDTAPNLCIDCFIFVTMTGLLPGLWVFALMTVVRRGLAVNRMYAQITHQMGVD